MQQLSVPDGSTQVLVQDAGLFRAKNRAQQVAFALQRAEALLQLDAVLQQLLERRDRKGGRRRNLFWTFKMHPFDFNGRKTKDPEQKKHR